LIAKRPVHLRLKQDLGYAAFLISGIGLSYNDQKIIKARELICAIAEGRPAEPDFAFGDAVTRVIDAVEKSAKERRWVIDPRVWTPSRSVVS
jgi:predicted dehydrogenase